MVKHYRLVFTRLAQKQLRKLDKYQARLIVEWLYANIDGTDNPYQSGKGLTANRSGQWRYRIGQYRVICEINDEQLVITAINSGHRRRIYDE
ncbi:addiction module toxin RelE [Lactobacillus lindneri] [Lactiplantibacillus mudanjiangensis]|uniref:type II toxin-antitoxin system RelE family toxin n=1 Tax=Lactiplantibacillus mudanjiangensis TaxID=1296538 RepID=UPI0010157599|nr:addiction module toxin RelE [Lactobacillus lindneri] [Lactiplantibacillus mudanjiangensis]